MPIYVYKCGNCGSESEEIRRVSEIDDPVPCPCGDHVYRERVSTTASFGFRTPGGNFASFSGAHGPVTRGSRRIPVIGEGHGLGGRRKFNREKVAVNPIPGEKP